MKLLSLIIIITFFSAAAFAQAGELDISFGEDGKIEDYIPFCNGGTVGCMAIQPDGKIIIAGTADVGGVLAWGWFIARYNTDGSIDSSFGYDGKIVSGSDLGAGVSSLAIQPDGSIVFVGYVYTYRFIDRYTINGSPDPNFTPAWDLVTYFWDNALALQTDGKIVVAGNASYGDFIIQRYNSDGLPDFSFNLTGMVNTSIHHSATAIDLLIQSDGKIVIAGASLDKFTLARYNSNGTADSTFNQNGVVTTAIGTESFISSVALQPDGKIVAGGGSGLSPDYDFTLARYNSDGTLDTTFGTDGFVILTGYDEVASLAIQPDGKIVTAWGSATNQLDFAVTRLNMDGTIDTAFGANGVVLTDFDNGYDVPSSIGLGPDRKIVVAGSDHHLELARYISGLNVGIINFTSSQTTFPLIYPNPIQQTETLEYTLTENESLTIALYDVNGKRIKNFVSNEQRTAGSHKEELNLGALATGNYFLTLSNGSQKMTVKMVKQ